MNPRATDALLIAFALCALGVVGGMDMDDAIAAEYAALPVCQAPLNLRVARTFDEVAGHCQQKTGATNE